jgi:hypothetical protein
MFHCRGANGLGTLEQARCLPTRRTRAPESERSTGQQTKLHAFGEVSLTAR